MMNKTMIEFFSGSARLSKEFKKAGYETLSIDYNKDLNPNLIMDILNVQLCHIPSKFHNPKVVWFSPPCTSFSVVTIGRNFKNNKPNSSKCYYNLALAYKCLELIKLLKPKYWFIENPRGMLRKQHFMDNLHRKTLTYCQYGEKYMKPTDIFTNAFHWIPRKRCKNKDICHEYQPRTYKNKINRGVIGLGVQGLKDAFERGKLPIELCKEIINVCENKISEKQTELKCLTNNK